MNDYMYVVHDMYDTCLIMYNVQHVYIYMHVAGIFSQI